MSLKTYSLRLDEDEYENLKKELSEYGDPDLNINFVIRQYIRDLNKALPDLKKSELGIRSNLAFWSSVFRQAARTAQLENIISGLPIVERIQKEDKEHEPKE